MLDDYHEPLHLSKNAAKAEMVTGWTELGMHATRQSNGCHALRIWRVRHSFTLTCLLLYCHKFVLCCGCEFCYYLNSLL